MRFLCEQALKGSDLTKAIRQIKSTLSKFQKELSGYDILPRVVIHKIPTHDVNSNEYRAFKKQYPKFRKGTLLLEDPV